MQNLNTKKLRENDAVRIKFMNATTHFFVTLTIKRRRMQPAAPGNNAYQRCKRWNLDPSMNNIGKLAAKLHKEKENHLLEHRLMHKAKMMMISKGGEGCPLRRII